MTRKMKRAEVANNLDIKYHEIPKKVPNLDIFSGNFSKLICMALILNLLIFCVINVFFLDFKGVFHKIWAIYS